MNTLLQTTANNWETYSKSDAASDLIVSSHIDMRQNKGNTNSTDAFEMNTAENRITNRASGIKTEYALSELLESLSRTLKVSA